MNLFSRNCMRMQDFPTPEIKEGFTCVTNDDVLEEISVGHFAFLLGIIQLLSSVGINQLKPTRNLRSKAEERVGRAIGGLRVLNSYWIAQDGTYKYYEVIMCDPAHNGIRNDPRINWIAKPHQKHR